MPPVVQTFCLCRAANQKDVALKGEELKQFQINCSQAQGNQDDFEL